MSDGHSTGLTTDSKTNNPFSYRPRKDLAPRIHKIAVVSKRSKASFLHDGLEMVLPAMEIKYAKELRDFDRQQKNGNGKAGRHE